MRYCTQLNVSSFSVGQLIQLSIGTFRDNIRVYTQLILSFIKVEHSRVHTPDDLPDVGTNVTGVCLNIEHMM